MCGSYAARDVHSRLGYDPGKMLVIANGFDAERFQPSAEGRRAFRERLGESESSLLIGLPARYHPQKDHGTFLRAAAEAAKSVPSLRFVMFGDRVDDSNEDLLRLVSENGLSVGLIRLNAASTDRKLLPPEFRRQRVEEFRPDVAKLPRLMDRDLSFWLADDRTTGQEPQ